MLGASCSSQAETTKGNSVEADSVGEESVGADLVEQVDIIQNALQESELCLNGFNWGSDTFDDRNLVSPVLETFVSSFGEVASVPNLWTVSGSREYDMEMGLNSKEVEEVHDIRPTVHYSKRNPGLFNPLKVGLKDIILFFFSKFQSAQSSASSSLK